MGMPLTEDELAIVWLCAKGAEYRERVSLLRSVSRPAELLAEERGDAEKLLRSMEEKGQFAVTLLSDDYPAELKLIPDPPLALFCAGNRDLLKRRKFCIVGSRITPPWAQVRTRETAERIAEHFTVVTGLAEGGDENAVLGALPSGNLICVLPCGPDECYPAAQFSLKKRVAEGGLLVTELRDGAGYHKGSFHARNRILAGLSEGVLVVSAGEKSGALITAGYALDGGRDVFAFPHDAGAKQGAGCNGLIKKGAYLAEGAEDILLFYGIEEKPRERAELSEDEARVYEVLSEGGAWHAAVIAERTGMKIYEVAATLASLELKNLAVKAGGNRYSAL